MSKMQGNRINVKELECENPTLYALCDKAHKKQYRESIASWIERTRKAKMMEEEKEKVERKRVRDHQMWAGRGQGEEQQTPSRQATRYMPA